MPSAAVLAAQQALAAAKQAEKAEKEKAADQTYVTGADVRRDDLSKQMIIKIDGVFKLYDVPHGYPSKFRYWEQSHFTGGTMPNGYPEKTLTDSRLELCYIEDTTQEKYDELKDATDRVLKIGAYAPSSTGGSAKKKRSAEAISAAVKKEVPGLKRHQSEKTLQLQQHINETGYEVVDEVQSVWGVCDEIDTKCDSILKLMKVGEDKSGEDYNEVMRALKKATAKIDELEETIKTTKNNNPSDEVKKLKKQVKKLEKALSAALASESQDMDDEDEDDDQGPEITASQENEGSGSKD